LTDKVVSSVAKANIESMLVAGYPAWTGGALQFIYGMGLAAFAARAHEFELSFGPGFALTDTVKATLEQHQPSY
jgi:3-hydroxyacyl-CoA dehydrogenase/enoyl-CoA hydratase/3-hydroxybutyryl-CoA epimerase